MVARAKNVDLAAHLQFRRKTLADAAEWMFAALQLHVDGCPLCRYRSCNDATHASVRAIREALRQDRVHPRVADRSRHRGAGSNEQESTESQPSTVESVPAVRLGQDEGEAFRLGPLEVIVKEDGSGTRMNIAVAEFRGDAFRIPPHIHTEHDETIHVLEGRMGVKLGERTFTATAGSAFTIPIDVPHEIWNESGARVRFLNVIVAARYLDYFREMAAAASTTGLPPPDVIARVMARYGIRPVEP